MNEQFKKVNNPLFSAAVTGATLEEFSQNAVLLPAQEKIPPVTVRLSQDQILSDIFSDRKATFQAELKDQNVGVDPADSNIIPPSSTIQQQNQGVTNLTSYFSNNLNVGQLSGNGHGTVQPPPLVNWNINNYTQSPLTPSIPPIPKYAPISSTSSAEPGILGQEQILNPVFSAPPPVLNQESTNPQPIPLFPTLSSDSGSLPKPPNNSSGSLNVFRRSGIKRPTYAQVPGLSTPVQPSQPLPVPPQHNLNPGAVPLGIENNSNLPNYFKPFAVPPHSAGLGVPLSQPLPTYLSKSSAQSSLSPVMDAIPDSEMIENNLPGSVPSQYINNDNTTNVNPTETQIYRPVYHHWFFKRENEGKQIWQPFSMIDSLALEHAFTSNDIDPDKFIATDGGRCDVNILRRQRIHVYWKGNPSEVRRCSWFHKRTPDGKLVPYEENIAAKLEEEYKSCFETNQWHKDVELANGETVKLHGPDVLVLFPPQQSPDAWGNPPNQSRPRVVKRGMDEFDIDEGEPAQVDHILFMVHGIGKVCDFKFRPVEEVVDEFRNIALQLVQSHYKSSCEKGIVHRVEVLPISWHDKLHSEDTGIDKQLKSITLESLPKLRDFTNNTLLDILFFTSPVYCQNIVSAVGNEINSIYSLFKKRNPSFNGGVSLAGHSLGSLILFDILCHQYPETDQEEEDEITSEPEAISSTPNKKPSPNKRKMCRRISYMTGNVGGTGQPQIHYPHLNFNPSAFFALGSPIGMFVIVRGLDTLGENFSLPTCPAFFNIFHPYDPIAYRTESLIHPDLGTLKPVQIPHHKGRKRMHLELQDTMARVGADLKQKVIDSMKSTWNSFYQLAMFHKQPSLEETVDKTFQEQLEKQDNEEEPTQESANCPLGNLNKGRRIDYVLQEAPFEFINDYLFALQSHVCYWESEDTILMLLKEIYSTLGVTTDSQIPQQTMTIERPPPSPQPVNIMQTTAAQKVTMGVDPTLQAQIKMDLNPPPTTGFIRKT